MMMKNFVAFVDIDIYMIYVKFAVTKDNNMTINSTSCLILIYGNLILSQLSSGKFALIYLILAAVSSVILCITIFWDWYNG